MPDLGGRHQRYSVTAVTPDDHRLAGRDAPQGGGVDDLDTPIATTVPCPTVAGTCAYDPAARFALADTNNALTGRIALSYSFDDGPLVYASYNRGYRAGAVNGGGYTSSVKGTITSEEGYKIESEFKKTFE